MGIMIGLSGFIFFLIHTLHKMIEEKFESLNEMNMSSMSTMEHRFRNLGDPITASIKMVLIISKISLYLYLVIIGLKISWILAVALFILRNQMAKVCSYWLGLVFVVLLRHIVKDENAKIIISNSQTLSTVITSRSIFYLPVLSVIMWVMSYLGIAKI